MAEFAVVSMKPENLRKYLEVDGFDFRHSVLMPIWIERETEDTVWARLGSEPPDDAPLVRLLREDIDMLQKMPEGLDFQRGCME